MFSVFLICLFPTVLCGNGTGTGGDWKYCTLNDDCGAGQGDCDGDAECSGSLICGDNNCKDFNPNDPNVKKYADCCRQGSKYVTYIPGNINLIFSVPHNGVKKPDIIPNRVDGCKGSDRVCVFPGSSPCSKKDRCRAVVLGDTGTRFIAVGARARLQEIGGGVPHMVISELHRSKMDPNRDEVEAAQNNSEALLAYKSFHETIKQVRDSWDGPGLLVDFHGQVHGYGSTEVGYLISTKKLNAGALDSSKLPLASSTSISSLVSRFNHTLEDLISGDAGIGSRIEQQNCSYRQQPCKYKAVPSPRQPSPGNQPFFNGGWIISQYGSRNGGEVDAIQLEFPPEVRTAKDKPEEDRLGFRTEFAKRLGDTISEFFNEFYVLR